MAIYLAAPAITTLMRMRAPAGRFRELLAVVTWMSMPITVIVALAVLLLPYCSFRMA